MLENKHRVLGLDWTPPGWFRGLGQRPYECKGPLSPQLCEYEECSVLVLPSDMQQHECAMSWKAHDGEVYSVEFSYDENTVYSIGEDGKVGSG